MSPHLVSRPIIPLSIQCLVAYIPFRRLNLSMIDRLVRFGTLNMPVITSQYIALFETLFSLPKTFPFIFCRDPKMLDLPKSLVELIESHQDTALMVEWSPQQTVLSHPALGWFLSHCGSNSASEAIVEGVGIIGKEDSQSFYRSIS